MIENIVHLIIKYWHTTILRFSDKYQSQHGWELSEDNTLVERIMAPVNEDFPEWEQVGVKKWILADTDPWFNGIHCWRIQINNPSKGWFSIGVANQEIDSLNADNFNTKYVWSIAASNNWYPGDKWELSHESFMEYIRLKYVEIDVYLDLDKDEPEMKITVATDNEDDTFEIKLFDAKPNNQGWVPYFNMYYQDAIGASIRAIFIDPESYGMPIENLFL